MRTILSEYIEKTYARQENIIFLTGDLGFNAFENLQSVLKQRFINMGVAEQNMISVAAGLAYSGYKVICYSIAPFITLRCLEQFRNDVCFHKLPVFLVGNGGGYGYGIMGSSHHALEDIACMSSMPNAKCYVPAFSDDVEPLLHEIISNAKPAYLRLGLGKNAPYMQRQTGDFSCVIKSEKPLITIFALGPTVNNVVEAIKNSDCSNRTDLFTVQKIPFQLHHDISGSLAASRNVLVVEEHYSSGGISEKLALKLVQNNMEVKHFRSLTASGYPEGLYGSQDYHLAQSGLDAEHIREVINQISKQLLFL